MGETNSIKLSLNSLDVNILILKEVIRMISNKDHPIHSDSSNAERTLADLTAQLEKLESSGHSDKINLTINGRMKYAAAAGRDDVLLECIDFTYKSVKYFTEKES